MLRVGLTGGIAAGKSAVADEFRRLGAVIIDADVLARAVVEPGTPALADIRERFGPEVLRADGTLDRPALGRLIFADDAARADLNAIVHPWVRATAEAIEREIEDSYAIVVHVIPLLVETGQGADFDATIVVDVDPVVQIARLTERDGLTATEAHARVAAQASREERLKIADYVIVNDGDREELRERCSAVWEALEHRRDGHHDDGC